MDFDKIRKTGDKSIGESEHMFTWDVVAMFEEYDRQLRIELDKEYRRRDNVDPPADDLLLQHLAECRKPHTHKKQLHDKKEPRGSNPGN